MNTFANEVTALDLTTENLTIDELARVAGGMRNQDTEAFHAFMGGFVKGFLDAGGAMEFTLKP